MRGRRTELGVRGRGNAGCARNRAPSPSKPKEHQSRFHNNSPLPHRPSRRSLSPRRVPRQIPSPEANRPRQSPPLRRSSSIDRHRGRGYMERRLGHEKHFPSSFDDEGFDFQRTNVLPESSSRTFMKDKDLGGPSSGLDGKDVLIQKSMFLDDGSKQTFYTLPEDPAYPFDSPVLNPSGLNVRMPQYDKLPRDPYSKDASFSLMPPPSQARPFDTTASSSFTKDTDFLRQYDDGVGLHKFSDYPMEYDDYDGARLSDHIRRAPLSPGAREEPLDYGYEKLGRRPLDYGYEKLGRRGKDPRGYLPSDGSYQKMVYGPRGEFRDAIDPSLFDFAVGRVDRDDTYLKKFGEGSSRDQHHYLHGDTTMRFRDMKGVSEDYVGSPGSAYVGLGPKASRDHELPPFEESYHLGRDAASLSYRDRTRSPRLADPPLDIYRHGLSPPRERSRLDADLGAYDLSPRRRLRSNYVLADDPNGRNVHRRIRSPIHGDEIWSFEEQGSMEERRRLLHPRKSDIGHARDRLSSYKMSGNVSRRLSSDSSSHVEGGSRGISLKRRLRSGPSDFHGSFASERRKEFLRPHKAVKRGQEDRNHSLDPPDRDVARSVKKEPPEDSEDFKQLVHKAFLRFSKLLNESPHQQKRYRDDRGKSSKLLCCVCGSLSKEFGDIESLLAHSYHCLKAGLRAEHLGLRKALCVHNSWNWLVAPDTSQAYRRRPPSELKALKEDLILWPPIVIIHNSSIGNKSNTNEPKVVSTDSMEQILKDMGIGEGKTRVCRGKPANQSVLLVKFMPTLSGLQEAERLHKYYADNDRGSEGFRKFASSTSGGSGEAWVEKDEELLYGYMAVAEDLDKLDHETKKRCVVKSKRDIEAIADAPLKID